ncbi:methionine--tRNA ligase [Kibdelosporangium lantanae]
MSRFYLSTVGVGSGRGLAQADALARHRRMRGDRVRFMVAAADVDVVEAWRQVLSLSVTEVVDTRRRDGANRLWAECVRTGDIYRNGPWYFRLSRHATRLAELLGSGELRVEPAGSRDELLAAVTGLADVRVRRRGDDWTAIASHVGGLGYGVDGPNHRRWWLESDQRVHVVGRDVLPLHALLWPAVLLATGLPLPHVVLSHDGTTDITHFSGARHSSDALRWWLLRDTGAFNATRTTRELAAGLGHVDRVLTLVHRHRDGVPPTAGGPAPGAERLTATCEDVPGLVHAAMSAYDFRAATDAVWRVVDEIGRYLAAARPWELAGDRFDVVLAALMAACRTLANELTPFLPTVAGRIADQCFSTARVPPVPIWPR